MTDEKCTVVITARPKAGAAEMPEYKEYTQKAMAIIQSHGGEVVQRYNIGQNLGNGAMPGAVILAQFPNRSNAENAFTNDDYSDIIPLRETAFDEVNILISNN